MEFYFITYKIQNFPNKNPAWVTWQPPPLRTIKLNTHGNVKGKGLLSITGLLHDHCGACIRICLSIGNTKRCQLTFKTRDETSPIWETKF